LAQSLCYITGTEGFNFDRGAELIYGKYLLMSTRALLPPKLRLPEDIARYVQETYRPGGVSVPPEVLTDYEAAKKREEKKAENKKTKAKTFQIVNPYKGMGDLVGWLDTGITSDPLGKRGEAAVRDIGNTLEVLVLQQRGGDYFMLPWLAKQGGRRIPVLEPPGEELAKALAECSIQLPHALCYKLDDTIEALEKIALGDLYRWQESPWLKGELFLVLDEDYTAELCGYHLQYDRDYGLLSKKQREGDGNGGEDF